jgi:hypothetical protein
MPGGEPLGATNWIGSLCDLGAHCRESGLATPHDVSDLAYLRQKLICPGGQDGQGRGRHRVAAVVR